MNGKILEEVYDRNTPYSDRIVSHSSSKDSTTTTRRVWRTILLMKGAFDNLHRDRIEMFSSKDHSSRGVLDLDGSLNADKSEKARKRKGPMYRK